MEALHANTMLTTYARYISFQRSGETISHSRDIIFYIFYKIIKISTIYIYIYIAIYYIIPIGHKN